MADASIPAWKRAGLKQVKRTLKQSETGYDPLKEGLKHVGDSADAQKPAKPAKRQKVPKAERPKPVHELDQLAYLRQFAEDRENWKFSKQKQNWILKNIYTDAIGEQYDKALLAYIESLMGSARGWAVDDAKRVIDNWNEFMQEDIKKDSDEPSTEDSKPDSKPEASKSDEMSSDSTDSTQKKKKKASQEPVKKAPSEKHARRAQQIVSILAGETPKLEYLDTE